MLTQNNWQPYAITRIEPIPSMPQIQMTHIKQFDKRTQLFYTLDAILHISNISKISQTEKDKQYAL